MTAFVSEDGRFTFSGQSERIVNVSNPFGYAKSNLPYLDFDDEEYESLVDEY